MPGNIGFRFVFQFAMQKYEDRNTQNYNFACIVSGFLRGVNEISGVPRGGLGCSNPPPDIPKALQNRAKLNPICENCKKLLNLGRQLLKMFGKKAVKF